jgi:hypothetical protein
MSSRVHRSPECQLLQLGPQTQQLLQFLALSRGAPANHIHGEVGQRWHAVQLQGAQRRVVVGKAELQRLQAQAHQAGHSD